MSGWLLNPSLDRNRAYGPEERAILSLEGAKTARETIAQWDGYKPTPLRDLASLAAECGLAQILYKDEGHRFTLRSFKALGGAYAVQRLVAARGTAEGLTVTCATDGNHGRAVAWGARRAGAKAVIYVHEGVSEGRAEAIRSFGRRCGARVRTTMPPCALPPMPLRRTAGRLSPIPPGPAMRMCRAM